MLTLISSIITRKIPKTNLPAICLQLAVKSKRLKNELKIKIIGGRSLAWSRTSACHAEDPGSNPGGRTIVGIKPQYLHFLFLNSLNQSGGSNNLGFNLVF